MYVYEIQTDFSADETGGVSGRSTVVTAKLDAELNNIQLATSNLVSALTAIQRNDGALLDGVVKIQSLAAEVLALVGSAGFNVRGAWVTGTAYAVRDLVKSGTGTYVCIGAHTAGVFATDLAAALWTPLYDTTALVASAISFTPGGHIAAANVQAAIAELDVEALHAASNLADLASIPAARAILGVPSSGDVQAATPIFAINTGGADALIGAYLPVVAALVNGLTLVIEATGPNTIAAPTFTPNNGVLAPLPIARANAQPLAPGDIAGAGARVLLSYHAGLAYWEILNPASNGANLGSPDIVAIPAGVVTAPVFGGKANITVVGTITSITNKPNGTRLVLRSILGNTFIHDPVNLIMRNGSNSTVAPGEIIEFLALEGAGAWSELTRRDSPARERALIKLGLAPLII